MTDHLNLLLSALGHAIQSAQQHDDEGLMDELGKAEFAAMQLHEEVMDIREDPERTEMVRITGYVTFPIDITLDLSRKQFESRDEWLDLLEDQGCFDPWGDRVEHEIDADPCMWDNG